MPGTAGGLLVEWARRAEERGFSTLVTIDRVAYPSYDSLTTLAASAAATSRIGVMTNILLGPIYPPALLAKATATLDQISGGRFTLGLAPGARADDYAAAGVDFHSRGRAFDDLLDLLHRAWRGEPIGDGGKAICPSPAQGANIPIMIGGTSHNAVRRAATVGAGWTAGGGGPEMAAPIVEQVRAAWRQAGRDGEPRLAALAYYSLGDDAAQESRAYLRDYYGYLGEWADGIAESALRSPTAIRDTVRAFEDIGITEVHLDPTAASLDQVDRLADAVL